MGPIDVLDIGYCDGNIALFFMSVKVLSSYSNKVFIDLFVQVLKIFMFLIFVTFLQVGGLEHLILIFSVNEMN